MPTRHFLTACTTLLVGLITTISAADIPTTVSYASYLGSDGDDDSVVGVHIAPDGTLLVAANIGLATPGGVTPTALPGFAPPSAAKPDPRAYEEKADYIDAGVAWIEANVTGAPPVPTLESLGPAIERAKEGVTKAFRLKAIPEQVLNGARESYVKTWLNGWRGGVLLRLSADGQKALSLLRIGPRVLDLAIDGQGRAYLAAGPTGAVCIEADGTTVRNGWPKLTKNGEVRRIDVSADGHVAVLSGGSRGTITVFDPQGTQLSQAKGSRLTKDVAINPTDKLYYLTGYKVSKAWSQVGKGWKHYPVHIAYLRARRLDSSNAWVNYDWRGPIDENPNEVPIEQLPARFVNRSSNNMADTRGCRVTMGEDGKLYTSFESAGGNHIFKYEPKDIMAPIGKKMAGGDQFHSMVNTAASHKGLIGRYDPATGDLIRIQEFSSQRLEKGRFPVANAFRMETGNLYIDAEGRVYLTGNAGSHLPIRFAPTFGNKTNPPTFNPFDQDAGGKGTYLMIMTPDMNTRLFTTRLSTSGHGHTVHAREVNGQITVAFGGSAGLGNPSYTRDAIQSSPAWGKSDGYLAMLKDIDSDAGSGFTRVAITGQTWTAAAKLEPVRTDTADLDGDGENDISIREALDPNAPLFTTADGMNLHGGIVSQVSKPGGRAVTGAAGLNINAKSGSMGIGSVPNAGKLKLEKKATTRQWAVIYATLPTAAGKRSLRRGCDIDASVKTRLQDVRLLIRDGEAWYVSQQNVAKDPSLFMRTDSEDGLFAPIDPAAVNASDKPPALAELAYQSMNFSDITAIGVLGCSDWRRAVGTGLGISSLSMTCAIGGSDDPLPVPVIKASHTNASAFTQIVFDGTDSHDHGRPVTFYRWKFGHDGGSSGLQMSHRFSKAGRHAIALTVWDDQGAKATATEYIDIALNAMPVADGQKVIAAWGGGGGGRFGIGGMKEHEGLSVRPVRLDTPMWKLGPGKLWGGVSAQKHKRPFFDYGGKNVGTPTQPVSQMIAKCKVPATVVVCLPQSAFMAGADTNGADISGGSLFAQGIKAGLRWVIKTPTGWRISGKVSGADGIHHQDVAGITWYAYNPEQPGDLGAAGKQVTESGTHVQAIGMALTPSSVLGFAAIGASGLPRR